MDTDTNIRLILSVIGSEGLERLRASTVGLKNQLEDAAGAYGRGEITAQQFEQQQRKLSAEIERQAGLLARLDAATDDAAKGGMARVADAAEKARSKTAGFGQSMLQAGRFVQDFQAAGVMGIANNLEQLAQALGGGPGLAGALTLLAVGWLVFGKQIQETLGTNLGNAVDTGKSHLERLKAKIDELEKKPTKLAIDVQQLEEAQKQVDAITAGIKAFEAFKASHTSDEEEAGKMVGQALRGAPGGADAVGKALQGDVADRMMRNDAEINKAREDIRFAQDALQAWRSKTITTPEEADVQIGQIARFEGLIQTASNQIDLRQQDIRNKLAPAAVGNVLTGAKGGDAGARQELVGMLNAVGMEDLAGRVGRANPAAVRAGRGLDEFYARDAAEAAESRKRADAATEAANTADIDRELAAAKAAQKADATAQAQAKLAGQAFNADVNRSVKQFAAGPLDEMAKEFAARMQAQGGDFDQNGQFRALDSNAQFARLASEIQRRMRAANPRQDPAVTEAAAARMAQQATEGLGLTRNVVGNMMGLSQVQTNMLTEMDQLRAETFALGRAVGANLTRSGRRRPMGLVGAPGG